MITVDVVIATRNRPQKLARVIDSIRGQIGGGTVYLAINGVRNEVILPASIQEAAEHGPRLKIVCEGENRGSVAGRNICLAAYLHDRAGQDVPVVIATDDVIFSDGSIQDAANLLQKFEKRGPALVGFTQTGNRQFHPAGIVMAGKNFVERFPGGAMYCPDYWHFACQELCEAAKRIGYFVLSKATVRHLNPITGNGEMDQTHADARKHKKQDFEIWADHQRRTVFWGFNRVTE